MTRTIDEELVIPLGVNVMADPPSVKTMLVSLSVSTMLAAKLHNKG